MTVVWSLADTFGVIPHPANERVAGLLRGWWSTPRSFGCRAAKRSAVWHVVHPDPRAWCARCAADRAEQERHCCYCSEPVASGSVLLVHEMHAGAVVVLARAHEGCHESGADHV
jgi:hypothetical protein